MGDVRAVEQRLASLEDRILENLGYRYFSVYVNGTLLDPKPEVIEKPLSSYSGSQLQGFSDALGGQGNPISTYRVSLSRDVNESLVRTYGYWQVNREGFETTCLPVDFTIKDARLIITLAVVKFEGDPPPLNRAGLWLDEQTWGAE